MTTYNVDKSCNVVKVTITLTLPSIKPDPIKLQKELKKAFKQYGMEVLFLQLAEIEKDSLLPVSVINKIFKHACKVKGM